MNDKLISLLENIVYLIGESRKNAITDYEMRELNDLLDDVKSELK